jgi:hypothetical protein
MVLHSDLFKNWYPCDICERAVESNSDLKIDYTNKKLSVINVDTFKPEGIPVCTGCLNDLITWVFGTFSKPLRDMPLLINSDNRYVREIARYRLKINE